MRRLLGFVVLVFGAAACNPSAGEPSAAEGGTGKGVVVDLDGLKSIAPGSWKEEAPSNRMRLTQFRLPKKGDDKEDAELVIFKGLGGGSKANVKRWKEQFAAPKEKSIDEVAKVTEMKLGGREAVYVDIQGTYLSSSQPFNPRAKKEEKPNYRMIAIYYDGKEDPYQIKLTGPAKTVEAYKSGFDEWLKNFK